MVMSCLEASGLLGEPGSLWFLQDISRSSQRIIFFMVRPPVSYCRVEAHCKFKFELIPRQKPSSSGPCGEVADTGHAISNG